MPHSDIRRFLRHGTLCQISTFEASARLGSVTRAAQELAMAQPTASMHIKKLAEAVGAPLFEHIGKRLFLTEPGRRLYASCDDLFRVLSQLESSLADLRGLKSGQLRLAISTAGRHFAPRLLAAYARRYPSIDVSLQIQNRRALSERLAANEDELYLFANPPDGDDLVRERFLRNPMVAVAAPEHALARVPHVTLARFAAEPFVSREPGSGTRMVVDHYFARAGLRMRPRIELGTDEAVVEAIVAGLGVSILSRWAVDADFAAGRLTSLSVAGLPIEGHWHFVYRAGKTLSPVARSFLEFCREHANAIAMGHEPPPANDDVNAMSRAA